MGHAQLGENDQWGWDSAVTDDPAELYAQWYAAAHRSRTSWAWLSADGGLDTVIVDTDPTGRRPAGGPFDGTYLSWWRTVNPSVET